MIVRSNLGKKWKWRFTSDYVVSLPVKAVPLTPKDYVLYSRAGNPMVHLKGNTLTIFVHYHFNGADMAPDWRSQLPQTARHDAMLQLAEEYEDITTDMAHEAFKPLESDEKKWLSWWRWAVVKLYWRGKKLV